MINSVGNIFKKHIAKCVTNDKYASKFLLGSAVALDFSTHIADSFELGHNKELKPEARKYLRVFELTNGFVSAAAQSAVGLALLSDKAQNFVIKQASKVPKLAKTLQENPAAKGNLRILTSLIGAVVITKRMIVPFITPIVTENVKKVIKFDDDDDDKNIFAKRKVKHYHDDDD